MTINEGTWDRVIRVVVSFALGYVAWSTWPTEASLLSRTGVVSFISLVIGLLRSSRARSAGVRSTRSWVSRRTSGSVFDQQE